MPGPAATNEGAGLAVPAAALTVVLAVAAIAGVTIWRASGEPIARPDPVRAPVPAIAQGEDPPVPAFTLTDHTGAAVSKDGARLGGKVWVVGFIFTRCATVCPRVTQAMVKLQHEVASPDVRFVAISVDPTHDTPQVLRDYGRDYGIDDRWVFLTGDKARVYELIEQGFRLAVDEAPADVPVAMKFVHSDRLAIVARDGTVRRYVRSTEAESVATAPSLVAALLAETAK